MFHLFAVLPPVYGVDKQMDMGPGWKFGPYKGPGFFPEIWPSEEQDEAWFESRDAKLGTLPSLNKILEKRNERHAWFLKSFREQPLKKDGPKATSFRFLWLRTFHDAICIKVDLKNSKTSVPVIRAETLSSGKSGKLSSGEPQKTPVWKLSPGQALALKKKFEDPALWKTSYFDMTGTFNYVELTEAAYRINSQNSSLPLPKIAGQQPVFPAQRKYVGADWFMESWDNGRYKSVCRWSPKEGPVRDLGIILLKMVDLCPSDPGEIY